MDITISFTKWHIIIWKNFFFDFFNFELSILFTKYIITSKYPVAQITVFSGAQNTKKLTVYMYWRHTLISSVSHELIKNHDVHVLKRAVPLSNGPWSSCFARTDAETCLLIGASSKTVNLSTTIPFRHISYSNRSCDKSNAHHRIFQKQDLLTIRINKYQQKIRVFFSPTSLSDITLPPVYSQTILHLALIDTHVTWIIQICYSIFKFLRICHWFVIWSLNHCFTKTVWQILDIFISRKKFLFNLITIQIIQIG